jgi:hypothetical protein
MVWPAANIVVQLIGDFGQRTVRVLQARPSRFIRAVDGGLAAAPGARAFCRCPARRPYWTVPGAWQGPIRPDGVRVRIPVNSNSRSGGSRTRNPVEVEHLFRTEGEHPLPVTRP